MGSIKKRRSAGAAVALVVAGGLVLAQGVVPASGIDGPYISYVKTSYGQNLQTALPDGTGTPASLLPSGITAYTYDVSADGSALLTWSATGTPTQAKNYDNTMAIVMTRGTESRIIPVYPWVLPTLSSDGMSAYVYTLSAGYSRIFKYSWAADTLTPITQSTGYDAPPDPTTPGSSLPLDALTVNPDGSAWAGNFGYGLQDGSIAASAVAVYALPNTTAPVWTSTDLLGTQKTSFRPIVWVSPTSFLVDTCNDSTCGTWSKHLIDLHPAAHPTTPSETPLPGLDNTYDVGSVNGTWFAWRDAGTGANMVSSYTELSDITSTPTTWTPRTNGATTFYYKPTAGIPVAQASPLNKMAMTATFMLSSTQAAQGKGLVYLAYGVYGGGSLTDALEFSVFRGALQFSTDNGRTYHTVATTTGAKAVTWPTANHRSGSGITPKLTRNTFVRWSYPGDVFTKPVVTPAHLVVVAPHVTAHVKKVGAKRIVSGTATRSGGRIELYRGGLLIAASTIKANGQYAFKALMLKRGTYTVIATVDSKWAMGTTSFKL